ncbi:hypothetical protein AGMMS49942_08930 [Spirochaetia bacterium]|nr:hypothetical protein AGMMS49942_08930 [Spirochaetia bacterium]
MKIAARNPVGLCGCFSYLCFSVTLRAMKISRLVFAALLACSALAAPQAQTFKPLTRLQVIKTAHFDIIYPAESERTARALEGFADALYDRVTTLLGIHEPKRIPVTITPHTEQFNGLTMFTPYMHIILYDTPMSAEWTTYTNSLEGLFLHELVHAISISSRDKSWQPFHRIFGGWATPAILTAPMFMVEGVTVSFESLDGTGRSNDPLVKESLVQAIHEDAFLSPQQASGIYDLPPTGNAAYYYGGLFNTWLQKTYGMEKYAELWASMGRDYRLSFWFYKTGYYYNFEKTYGRPLLEAWDEFKASLMLPGIEENSGGVVFNGPFYNKKALIKGLASGGGKVFALDTVSHRLISYDPGSGKLKSHFFVAYPYDLAVSADGGRALVSSYRYNGDLAQAIVTEYDIRRGVKIGRPREGLYDAAYFRDGVVGLRATGHINTIVYGEEVLLRGSAELLYSNPTAVDDTWIVFTAVKRGRRELCLFNYETRDVYTLASDLEDDEERWRYIRGLTVSEGHILFSYDHDGGMYKLALLDLDAMTVVFSERDFSGGIFLPVMAGDEIYYRGAFTTWDALMRFPEAASALSGVRSSLRRKPWDEADLATAFPAAEPEPPVFSTVAESRPYTGLSYLNPFRYWIPYPLIETRMEGGDFASFRFTKAGVGIFSMMSDPAARNQITLNAAFDALNLMGVFDIRWQNTYFGFPLTLSFTDNLNTSRSLWRRNTVTSLSGTLSHSLGVTGTRGFLLPGFGVRFTANDPLDSSYPYTWPYAKPLYVFSIGAGISNLTRSSWELFGGGISFAAYGLYGLRDAAVSYHPRVEGVLQTAFESIMPLPMRLRFFGAWDKNLMTLSGDSSVFTDASFADFAPAEYDSAANVGMEWLAGGEAEVKLFSLEIQKSPSTWFLFSHLYFNRFFGTLAYRGAFYDDGGVSSAVGNQVGDTYRLTQSLLLRLGLTFSNATIPLLPVTLSFNVQGGWKISNLNDGNPNNDFWVSLTLGTLPVGTWEFAKGRRASR